MIDFGWVSDSSYCLSVLTLSRENAYLCGNEHLYLLDAAILWVS